MNITETKIAGVKIISPQRYSDNRGYFLESYQKKRYQMAGIDAEFVQDNMSRSTGCVLRGLHYQLEKPQGKLVSVIRGKVLDVVVDIRKSSPTFGQWISEMLTDTNHTQLYVPPGCAHGFMVMSEVADFYYKCTDYYNPGDEYGIKWSDPDLNINWRMEMAPCLSKKDHEFPFLRDIPEALLPE